jgi:hypothetical protein
LKGSDITVAGTESDEVERKFGSIDIWQTIVEKAAASKIKDENSKEAKARTRTIYLIA